MHQGIRVTVGVLVAILLLKQIAFFYSVRGLVRARSRIDGAFYWVSKPQATETSDFLATLKQKLEPLWTTLRKHRHENPDVRRLLAAFPTPKHIPLRENNAKRSKEIAWNQNKTEGVFLCVRDGNHFMSMGDALYVLLHEMAHTMTWGYFWEPSHSHRFTQNLTVLRTLAVQSGVAVSSSVQGMYCGIKTQT